MATQRLNNGLRHFRPVRLNAMLARARELATNGAAEAADNKTPQTKTPTLPR
jgi:hypothetical protein